jgi:hypothetical protein
MGWSGTLGWAILITVSALADSVFRLIKPMMAEAAKQVVFLRKFCISVPLCLFVIY